jgi:hypothetical protein
MTGLLAWNSPWLERGLLVEFTIQSFLRVLADGGVGSGRRAFERVLVDGNWDN